MHRDQQLKKKGLLLLCSQKQYGKDALITFLFYFTFSLYYFESTWQNGCLMDSCTGLSSLIPDAFFLCLRVCLELTFTFLI